VVIRNGKFDFQNAVRYQNISGDFKSWGYAIIKAILIHPMRTETFFRFKRILKRIPSVLHIAAYVAFFFLGRWMGAKV
jgi:hypothetical protein